MKKIEMVRELGKVQVALAAMCENMKKQEDVDVINGIHTKLDNVIDSLVNDEEELE